MLTKGRSLKYLIVTLLAFLLGAGFLMPLSASASQMWEVEDNNGVATATNVTLGAEVVGDLSRSSDEDYYKFTLPADGYVTWDFWHDLVSDDDYVWEATLFDANADKIASYLYKGSASSADRSAQLGLPKGSYYLLVEVDDSYDWDSATYRFKVNYTQANNWETEFNGGVSSADPISLSTAYNASLRTSSDEDYFRFKLENNAHISISFQHNTVNDSYTCWEASLLDADSNTVRSFDYDCNDSSMKRSESIRLNAGTYYFKVEPGHHHSDYTYTFKASIPQPAAKVTYGAWKTEKKYCSTYKVRQSRSVTKTPYVWNSGKSAWVLNTKAASTTKEYRNYNMTAAEKKTCSSSATAASQGKQPAAKVTYGAWKTEKKYCSTYKVRQSRSVTKTPYAWNSSKSAWVLNTKAASTTKEYRNYNMTAAEKKTCSSSSVSKSGWKQISGKWYYYNASGAKLKGWLHTGGSWYFLDKTTGVMKTGWLVDGGKKYWLSSSGAMITGWKMAKNGNWYYFDGSGAMRRGWVNTGGSWYFLDKTTGVMKTGWLVDGGKKYWLSSSGAMITGWKMAKNGNWYYFDGSGAMVKGWLRQGNTWYYLLPSGVMAKGTVVISGRKSAFSSSGAWLGYR